MTTLTLLKTPVAAALAGSESTLALPPGGAARNALKRAKLWELDEKHLCPVIGTCLPVDELVKLGRRFFAQVDAREHFALHHEAVGQAKNRNNASEALHKHLERKYRTQIIAFERAKNDLEVLAAWQEHYARGDVAGALWAALTHRAASAETKQRVYADVHMLSHQIGAGQSAGVRRLSSLESECAAARVALERQKTLQAASEAKLRLQLQKALGECHRLRPAHDEATRLQARLLSFESGSAMIEMGRQLLALRAANEELMSTVQRGWALDKTLKAAHQEAQALARERDQLSVERDALARLLVAADAEHGAEHGAEHRPDARSDCAGECPRCDPTRSSQCVLYVGGRSSLLAHYRALAGRLGIRLIHHDGGVEESLSRLPEMIKGADAVICPTDCVSHSAYYQLKRQCKRSGKPCLLFKGAGVSGFAVALARLAAGQLTLTASAISFA